jgi:hypothetical protein
MPLRLGDEQQSDLWLSAGGLLAGPSLVPISASVERFSFEAQPSWRMRSEDPVLRDKIFDLQ